MTFGDGGRTHWDTLFRKKEFCSGRTVYATTHVIVALYSALACEQRNVKRTEHHWMEEENAPAMPGLGVSEFPRLEPEIDGHLLNGGYRGGTTEFSDHQEGESQPTA
jgi:hypothetical protein